MAEEKLEIIDNIHLTLKDIIQKKERIVVEGILGPKQIIISSGKRLQAGDSKLLPLIPVGIISYEELKFPPYGKGELSLALKPIENIIFKEISEKILKPGTEITVQLMDDSYYYSSEDLKKSFNKEKGIPCIIYIGDKTYQKALVETGYAIYNNSEYFRIKDVFLQKGDIDRYFIEELSEAEVLAISEKKGFWSDEYAFSRNIEAVIGELQKKAKISTGYLDEQLTKIKEGAKIREGSKPADRLKARQEKIARERENYNRKFSSSSFGEQLSSYSERYFPSMTGEEIIKAIVAGLLPKSAMQIGALWCGLPTYQEEKAGLGASSHPVEIVEVKKDGDVRPILGQGFLSMVMGDRPPMEGITLILSVSSRAIETFLAPLITQFRMDPIIPIRNIHLARFTRPIFSNKELYSKVYGKLPSNLAKLVNSSGEYSAEDAAEVRELSRVIELMYLTVPIYVAVKQVQVQNLQNNDGSFTVTINCGVADVTENFGYFPEYFKTVDDAFEIHKKRIKTTDKLNTYSAIKHISKQLGSSSILSNLTFSSETGSEDTKANVRKFFLGIKSKPESVKTNFILRESKLVEIPSKVTLIEAQAQTSGKGISKLIHKVDKINVSNFLVYKPSLGTTSNYKLMKDILRIKDMNYKDKREADVLIKHFSQNSGTDSQIPIPTGPSHKFRRGLVTNKDLIPKDGNSTPFLNTAIKTEKENAIDKALVPIDRNPVGALFGINIEKSDVSVLRSNYSNWKDNTVVGLGVNPLLKPFDVLATRNIPTGDNVTITNLDVEYACSFGLPILSAARDAQKNILLDIIGNVDLDNLTYNPVTFYETNTKKQNRNLTYIALGTNKKLNLALYTVVGSVASSFVPEMTAFFGYKFSESIQKLKQYKNIPAAGVDTDEFIDMNDIANAAIEIVSPGATEAAAVTTTIQGVYGSLKFHNSLYKSVTYISNNSNRNPIKISDGRSGTVILSRDSISQEIDAWVNVNKNIILGEKEKAPLKFDVKYRVNKGNASVTVGLTDVIESSRGKTLFVFKEVTKNTKVPAETIIVRSTKYEEQLLNLVGNYIGILQSIQKQEEENSKDKDKKSKKSAANKASAKKPFVANDGSKKILLAIRNIVQSILNKDTQNLLDKNDIPDALTGMSQVLSSMKSFRGTYFLDESEPYVFSLLYQLGVVKESRYSMTFMVRPDRVAYKAPTFIDENYTSMKMEIFRSEPPKEEDRTDAYSNALKSNEDFITRMDGRESFKSYITETAAANLSSVTGIQDPRAIEKELRNPIYVVSAMQSLLLRYFDFIFSAHVVARAGGKLIEAQKKSITSPDDVNKREQGLISKDVENVLNSEKTEAIKKINQIHNNLKSFVPPSKKPTDLKSVSKNSGVEVSELPRSPDQLLKKGYTFSDLVHINIKSLLNIVDTSSQRIYDSKTPTGKHFATSENILRLLSFAGINNTTGVGSITTTTGSVLSRVIRLYARTIDILNSKQLSSTLFTLTKGTIEPKGSVVEEIIALTSDLQAIVSLTQKMRLATGNSLDFVKRKTLQLKKPIPSIGIIEEYGVSSPLRVPGKKKPSYQVIGSVSTQAYIQLNTNISDLYLSEFSKLKDVISSEEGMDAIYNIMREPTEITTVYNMLRAGRAMTRDATGFTKGSNSLTNVGTNNQTIQEAFRLIKRTSVANANIDAYGTLLGLTDPHIYIEEPLFAALGLSRFVAKTTKISSGGNTTSWKLDIFLLPYEAGYTTNKNLKKVNRVLSNSQMADISAWLGAAYNPNVLFESSEKDTPDVSSIRTGDAATAQASYTIQQLKIQEEIERKSKLPKKPIDQVDNKIFKSKTTVARFALSAVFSNLVAIHAIYKAKQKIIKGIVDQNIGHPSFYNKLNDKAFSVDSDGKAINSPSANEVRDAYTIASDLRHRVITEVDLSPSDFNIVATYGELGQTGSIPTSVSYGDSTALLIGGSVASTGLEFWAGKTSKFLLKTPLRFAAALIDPLIALGSAGTGNVKITQADVSVITQTLKNNVSVNIMLSQNFGVYALDFLKDFFYEESLNPGSGVAFLEKMASEAESVMNNAGSVNGIQFFNVGAVNEEARTVSTSSGAIVSTYPIGSLIQNGRQRDSFFMQDPNSPDGSRLVENISIAIINSAISGDAASLGSNLAFETYANDMYTKDRSFFKSYFQQIGNDRTAVDVCGEELLQLIVDGQCAMFSTDIYSIGVNPKYVAAEPSFYYSAMMGIVGRLKVNHFAQYLVGGATALLHSRKISGLFGKNSNKEVNDTIKSFYSKYLGITKVTPSLVKTLPISFIKTNIVKLVKSGLSREIEIIREMGESFPLANGRVIFTRIYTGLVLLHRVSGKDFAEYIGQFEAYLRSLNSLCAQIKSQLPSSKKPSEPIPNLISITAILGSRNQSSDTVTSPEVFIPANTNIDALNQSVKSIDIKDYERNSLLEQIRNTLIEHGTWLLNSYGLLLNGATQSDMSKSDPVYGLRYAVINQLAFNRSEELGIDFPDAFEEVRSYTEKEFFDNATNSTYASLIQDACDEIALYSTGNTTGKKSLFREYTVFLETFRELFVQIPTTKNKDGEFVKAHEDGMDAAAVSASSPLFTFSKRREDKLWSNSDKVDYDGFIKSISNDPQKAKIFNVVDTFRYSGSQNEIPLSGFSALDPRNTGTLEINQKAHAFMSVRYGVERPEYVPSVLARWQNSDGQITIYRTSVSAEALRYYANNFSQSFGDYLTNAYRIYITGDSAPLSISALTHAAGVAAGIGTFVGIVAGGWVVGLIAAVIVFIGIVILQLINASPNTTIADFHKRFLDKMKVQIGKTAIATTPLFVGMKALLEQCNGINETDLIYISLLGTKGASAGPRSEVYVKAPNIDNLIETSNYILQDVLSYLTLPLITNSKVSTIADVLSPGGHVLPDIRRFNDNQKSLSTSLLIQEGFFRDHLEKLPEFMEAERVKAIGLGSNNINNSDFEPRNPASVEFEYFNGCVRFITNMEGIYIGGLKKNVKKEGKKYVNELYMDQSVGGTNTRTHVISAEYQLSKVYSKLRKLILAGREAFDQKRAIEDIGAASGAADTLVPYSQDVLSSVIERVKKSKSEGLYIVNPGNNWKAILKNIATDNILYYLLSGDTNINLRYANFVNKKSFLTGILGDVYSTNNKSFVVPGVYEEVDSLMGHTSRIKVFKFVDSDLILYKSIVQSANGSNGQRDFLQFSFNFWPQNSLPTGTAATVYLNSGNRKITKVIGTPRGTGSGFFRSESDAPVLREVAAEAMDIKRAINSSDENESVLLKVIGNEGLFDKAYTGAVIVKDNTIRETVIISERILYMFMSEMSETKIGFAMMEGNAFIRAAGLLRNQYSPISDEPYLVINRKKPLPYDFSFVELYAAKIALDSTVDGTDLVITWSNIFQALEDIGCYLSYVSYASKIYYASGATRDSALYINRSDKVFQAPNAKTIGAFAKNNIASVEVQNGVFAATTGLSTQYVLDKLEEFMDQEASMQWESLGKAAKEVRNVINASLKMYPTVKLYFVKKERGGYVLYDDIYSYADIISVKIFDSSKTPGTTILIQLANTENKLDNIIAAKDNAKNPFEVRARSEDQLSGLMLKAGTRIMVYMGYGNVLTEENKYLAEIASTSNNPDGTVTIEARGPGWILNNPISASGSKNSASGKTLTIDGSQLQNAILPASPTDTKPKPIAEFGNPAPAIARSLLLYGMLILTDISRYGRLGSILDESVEYTSGLVPPDASNYYISLAQNGLTHTGFDPATFIAAAKEVISKALVGDLPTSASGYFKKEENTKVNTFSRNILLSESFPTVAGGVDSMLLWMKKIVNFLGQSQNPNWKINNETYWEFIKEVTLPIPNAKSFVRSYETDGSLVIGNADEYYTMYNPRSFNSRVANDIYKEIYTVKESRDLKDLVFRFKKNCIDPLIKNSDPAILEICAEIITGTIVGLMFNGSDSGNISDLLKRAGNAVSPLPNISLTSTLNVSDLFNQLKNKNMLAYVLTDLLTRMWNFRYSNNITLEVTDKTFVEAFKEDFVGDGLSIPDLILLASPGAKVLKSGISAFINSGEKKTEGYINLNAEQSKPLDQKFGYCSNILLYSFQFLNDNKSSGSYKKFYALLETAMRLGFEGNINKDLIKDTEKALSENNTSQDYGKRIFFTLVTSIARVFNNKIHKLRSLSPERRKIQEHFFIFNERDIIHNNAQTMLGYNEGDFVFENIRSSVGDSNDFWNDIGGIITPFSSDIARFPFSVDPVASEAGGVSDYTAKRLMVNLNNPGYYSQFMSISSEGKAALFSVLSIMATSQMAEMVKDWYGGEIYTYGDTEKKPVDVIYMHDAIRDMYGPFEIKEEVHSFDTDGFITMYSPSVYTRSEPRSISDDSSGSGYTMLTNIILGGLGILGVIKGRSILARVLAKIPGVGSSIAKLRTGILAGTIVQEGFKQGLKHPIRNGGKLASRGLLYLANKIILDPIFRATPYAKIFKDKQSIKALKTVVSDPKIVDEWLRVNGFKDKAEFITAWRDIEKGAKEFLGAAKKQYDDLIAEAAKNPDVKKRTEEIKKLTDEFNNNYQKLVDRFLEKGSNSLYDNIVTGKNITDKTYILKDLKNSSEKFAPDVVATVGSRNYSDEMRNFISFVHGIDYTPKIKDVHVLDGIFLPQRLVSSEIIDPTNARNLKNILDAGSDIGTGSVTSIAMEKLRKYNADGISTGKVGSKAKETHGSMMDEALTGDYLPDKEVAKLKSAFSTIDSETGHRAFAKQFVEKAEAAINNKVKTITIKGETIELSDVFIVRCTIARNERLAVIEKIAKEGIEELTTLRNVLADPNVSYKNLPKRAKEIVDNSSKLIVSGFEERANTIQKELDKLRDSISKLKKSSDTADLAKVPSLEVQVVEAKAEMVQVKKRIEDLNKQLSGNELKKIGLDNIEDLLKNKLDATVKGFTDIAGEGVKEIEIDRALSMLYHAAEDGSRNKKNYDIVRSAFRQRTDMVFNPDPTANFKGIVKSLGAIFGIWQTYSTVSSLAGDSITNYRLMLGAQKATDALITEFMVYKGEPYLANLEGLTRNNSKLISPNSSYWEYLKSRFFNFDEMGDFLTKNLNLSINTSLTQYSDVLLNTNIDDGLYTSLDQGLKFRDRESSAQSSSFANSSIADLGKSDALVAPFYTNKARIVSRYGWRWLPKSGANWDPGIDIRSGEDYAGPDLKQTIEKNKVRAIETGIAFTSDTSMKFSVLENALINIGWPGKDGDGRRNQSALIYTYLLGLETGVLWGYAHVFPNLNQKVGFSASLWEESKIPTVTRSGEHMGFQGPFGGIRGPHIHLDTLIPKRKHASFINELQALYNKGKNEDIGKNTELIEYIKKNKTKIYNLSYDRGNIEDPEKVIANYKSLIGFFAAHYNKDYMHHKIPDEIRVVHGKNDAEIAKNKQIITELLGKG